MCVCSMHRLPYMGRAPKFAESKILISFAVYTRSRGTSLTVMPALRGPCLCGLLFLAYLSLQEPCDDHETGIGYIPACESSL